LEKLADAHRQRVVLEAEAEAEAIRLNGEAQAFAIEAKAKAEAEQMSKKAAAFKEYREAAMVDMLLNTLPKVRLMERRYCIIYFSLSFPTTKTDTNRQKRFKQVNIN
jgi:flotillin